MHFTSGQYIIKPVFEKNDRDAITSFTQHYFEGSISALSNTTFHNDGNVLYLVLSNTVVTNHMCLLSTFLF